MQSTLFVRLELSLPAVSCQVLNWWWIHAFQRHMLTWICWTLIPYAPVIITINPRPTLGFGKLLQLAEKELVHFRIGLLKITLSKLPSGSEGWVMSESPELSISHELKEHLLLAKLCQTIPKLSQAIDPPQFGVDSVSFLNSEGQFISCPARSPSS